MGPPWKECCYIVSRRDPVVIYGEVVEGAEEVTPGRGGGRRARKRPVAPTGRRRMAFTIGVVSIVGGTFLAHGRHRESKEMAEKAKSAQRG